MTPLYVRARLHEARAILADPASRASLRLLAERVVKRWGNLFE
jgi:hypothetical protein